MRSVGATLVKLIATATSGLVSFTTNVIRPVKVICEFTPVQDGTGDPSPDNVRPISGWTGATVNHIAKYYYTAIDASSSGINRTSLNDGKTIHIQGTATAYTAYTISTDFVPESESLTIFGIPSVTVSGRGFCLYDVTTGDVVGNFFKSGETVIRAVSKTHTYRLGLEIGARQSVDITITPRIADTDSYITLPINWQSEAGTVYGGTVTLNEDESADLVVDQGIIRGVTGISGYPFRGHRSAYIRVADMKKMNGWAGGVCNIIQPKHTGGIGDYSADPPTVQCGWGDNNVFLWKIGELVESVLGHTPTAVEITNWLNDNNFMCNYPLDTPVTYHFDNVGQLQSFIGTNNIWHDMNGGITAEYWNKQ